MRLRRHTKPEMQVMEDAELAGGNTACVVILCAEDAIRAAIAYWTASLPLRTVVANDGYQANRILRNGDCRLLVTDRVLPPWPGLDTFRQMRERNTDLRIAFVEGTRREDVGLARATGATDVLSRPLRRQLVTDVVDKAMRTP
jgi:DNA-binding response OmpR family regulator